MLVNTSRLQDAIWGLAVADALGVPYEGMTRWSFTCSGMVSGGTHGMPAGTWSDDTSMTLATCDSIKACGALDTQDMRERFVSWAADGAYTQTGESFGIGHTTYVALMQGKGCTDEQNNGNGSLMRIIPLAFTDATDEQIREVSAITHAHDLSCDACVIYVHIARKLLEGKDITEAIKECGPYEGRFSALNRFASSFACCECTLRSTGFVLDTLDAALSCLLACQSFEESVLMAVNMGDDTDTVAAVTGALAGIIYGKQAIPQSWIDELYKQEIIENVLF